MLERIFRSNLSRKKIESLAPPPRPKLGLALGGGFARGMAHIGVLKVLEEEKIPVDFIAGTSVGAALGAIYCSGVSAKEMEELAAILKFSHIARWTLSRMGLCSNDRLAGLLAKTLKVQTFEELRIPLAVSATDFVTGESVVFTSGPLVDPVRASCAYPGVFLPVSVNGRLMVDGLLAHPVPATPLKQMGAEKVIAVYFNSHWVGATGPKHFMDVIGQCFSIAQARMCELWQVNADLILEPDVQPFAYDAFHKSSELIKAGEASARAALPSILAWFEGKVPEIRPAKESVTLNITPATLPLAS
ncbi:MAG TPA: patatin-like phospholipase family protein [Terriglobales bacterium]|nr:patatin-like phospholipase family protein [Terriglobales bacterium]